MKYIKQRNNTDCGIVCLMNAFIWAGKSLTYDNSKEYFKDKIDYTSGLGVYPESLREYLFSCNKDTAPFELCQIIRRPTIEQLKDNINNDSIWIFGINETSWSHIGIILKITDKNVILVNWDNKKVQQRMSIIKFKELLEKYTEGYLIRKLK